MQIRIRCPECGLPLKDRFGNKSCKIHIGYTVWLDLECTNCKQEYDVSLCLKAEPGILKIDDGGKE